jgi:signal transduction histidine kinase
VRAVAPRATPPDNTAEYLMTPEMSAIEQSPVEGFSLPGCLRDCLNPAVILVRGSQTIWTDRAKELLNVGDSLSAAAAVGLAAPLFALAEEAGRSASGTASRTLKYGTGDGPPLSVHASALRLPGPNSQGVVLVLNELTRAQTLDQLLLHADRLANVGTISASMAHEVRNAMVACRTFVDLLLEKHQDAELAGVVRREMKRIDDLIGRMLKHSSISAGQRRSLHLHEVLDNALRLLQPHFAEKAITVERSFEAAPDLLDGDENQLQQAFMNLLLNGCEAAPYQGCLKAQTGRIIGGSAGPPAIVVTIADNGMGIAPENLGRVFQPFFTTKPEGTGLGLAVTHRIVREHLGTITVESQPGQGASFRLSFPV